MDEILFRWMSGASRWPLIRQWEMQGFGGSASFADPGPRAGVMCCNEYEEDEGNYASKHGCARCLNHGMSLLLS